MTMFKFEVGSVGKYGIRYIVRGYETICHVPLPPQDMTSTIEERRARRDARAKQIVDSLNGVGLPPEWGGADEDETGQPATGSSRAQKEQVR